MHLPTIWAYISERNLRRDDKTVAEPTCHDRTDSTNAISILSFFFQWRAKTQVPLVIVMWSHIVIWPCFVVWPQIVVWPHIALLTCRVASTNQGSPLRGVPSQGAFNSPSGSPSTSAVFSPGSLPTGDDSPAAYSASSSSPAQSLPERAHSSQLSQAREAAAAAEPGRGEAEGKAPELKETARRLQVPASFHL